MSFVDIAYEPNVGDGYVPDVPDIPDVPTIKEPEIIPYPVRPLPDVEIAVINIFGGDGTINLANIILFLGIGLFIMSFLTRR